MSKDMHSKYEYYEILYTDKQEKNQQITKQSKSNTLISLMKIIMKISNWFFSQLEISLPFPSDESKINIEKRKLFMVWHGNAFSIYQMWASLSS